MGNSDNLCVASEASSLCDSFVFCGAWFHSILVNPEEIKTLLEVLPSHVVGTDIIQVGRCFPHLSMVVEITNFLL